MKTSNEIKNKYSKWFASVAALFGVVIVFYFFTAASASNKDTTSPAMNTSAPQFTLTDIEGNPVSLSKLRGKVVILDFWATWCPPCRMEIPDLIALQKQYGSQGLQIIGIGLDEKNTVASFVKQHGINYPVAIGTDEVSNLFGGISGIPTTFIIDKQGNIQNKFEGYTKKNVFEKEIKKLL